MWPIGRNARRPSPAPKRTQASQQTSPRTPQDHLQVGPTGPGRWQRSIGDTTTRHLANKPQTRYTGNDLEPVTARATAENAASAPVDRRSVYGMASIAV